MAVTGKLKTGEAGPKVHIARAPTNGPPNPPNRSEATAKNDGVNFHIEITVTKGEHAHVFKFECGDKHVTAAGKGLVRMRGSFDHLRKD
jgi:hypothetical protein